MTDVVSGTRFALAISRAATVMRPAARIELISAMTRIYRKLGVRNRNEAAFKAWKLGMV